jgi:hypothetical protein
LFRGEPSLIKEWRFADKQQIRKKFSPIRVREALDKRYGHTAKKRAELYQLFSELAAHPTMKSALMMRPEIGGDAVIGPFVEKRALEAQLSEMGRLAVQAGDHLGFCVVGVFEMERSIQFSEQRLLQASAYLLNQLAEVQQLRAAIQSAEASARCRSLADPKVIDTSAGRELRA